MAVTRILRPPLDAQDVNSWVWKKWFNDQYLYTKSGVLIPAGGSTNISDIPYIYGGKRNITINGDFQIWQRGTSFTSTGAATPDYTADRWSMSRAAGTELVSRQSTGGLTGFQYCARVSRSAADATTPVIFFVQALETNRVLPLAGQTVTLSFWARGGSGFNSTNNVTYNSGFQQPGILEVTLSVGAGTDEGPFASLTAPSSNPIRTAVTPTTTWTFYQFTAVMPSTATDAKQYFSFSPNNFATANNYFEVTGVQLEIGKRATAYDFLPFVLSHRECMRFYQKSFPYATTPAQNTGSLVGAATWTTSGAGVFTNYNNSFPYPVPMRVSPTMTYYNPQAANAQAKNLSTGTDATNTTTSGVSSAETFHVAAVGPAGWGIGNLLLVHWAAAAEL